MDYVVHSENINQKDKVKMIQADPFLSLYQWHFIGDSSRRGKDHGALMFIHHWPLDPGTLSAGCESVGASVFSSVRLLRRITLP